MAQQHANSTCVCGLACTVVVVHNTEQHKRVHDHGGLARAAHVCVRSVCVSEGKRGERRCTGRKEENDLANGMRGWV